MDKSDENMLRDLSRIKKGKTRRVSSWDTTGRNADAWIVQPGETRVLADIEGPGIITHVWMTQRNHYREVLLKFTWDDAPGPSIFVPLGDFFCLGHGIVNSFQSLLFTASTNANNGSNSGCALNCYAPMPFKKRALVELVNQSKEAHRQYFYIDYEIFEDEGDLDDGVGYLHAEFRRENPFGGWGDEIQVNSPESDIHNKERLAWDNNYVIVEARGRGHYIGCNLSITNLHGGWWGEGDDMIWVDGYKWPPDLHGTGSEDYLNQAWGMQPNAFLRNGSSIYEHDTGGYQTSYVFHLENPVRFEREVKVTIEHGHGNHLANEVSSVGYWYLEEPTPVRDPPPVEKRLPVLKRGGKWVRDVSREITTRVVEPNEEMLAMKRRWRGKNFPAHVGIEGPLLEQDGQLFTRIQFSPENPTLYEIPLEELLEFFVDKPVDLRVGGVKRSGVLRSVPSGGFSVEGPGGESTRLLDLARDLVGRQVEIDTLLSLDDDWNVVTPERYEISIEPTDGE
ncbi:MAG: glycoside hydrolase family 172 protein [Promethearchaeota archaeon]